MHKTGRSASALLWAVRKGYCVDAVGVVYGADGAEISLRPDGEGYRVFTAGPGNSRERTSVRVQYLVAYQKYGERLFELGVQVRHLDGVRSNNRELNIALGTASENMLDRPVKERVAHARKAARVLRKLTDMEVRQLRRDREQGLTYRELCEKYSMTKSGVSYLLHRKTYRDVR